MIFLLSPIMLRLIEILLSEDGVLESQLKEFATLFKNSNRSNTHGTAIADSLLIRIPAAAFVSDECIHRGFVENDIEFAVTELFQILNIADYPFLIRESLFHIFNHS